MATVASLNVLLTASTAAFSKSMKTAERAVMGFGSSVKGMVTGTLGFMKSFAGIGGLIAGAGLTVGLKNAAEAMDKTAKAAATLGMSSEDLVGLQHAANLAGVDAETLNAALAKMLSTVGHTNLGIVADQISGISDPVERASFASDIFGKNWRVMMPLLLEGSKGIAKASEEAGKLNMKFSEMDVDKVMQANDAITKMQGALKGAFQIFAIEFAPAITEVATRAANSFSDIAKKASSTFKAISNEVGFFIGSWNLQWELLKADAFIAWETIRAGSVGTFDAIKAALGVLYHNFKVTFQDIGSLILALGKAVVAYFSAPFEGIDPIGAFVDTFKRELAAGMAQREVQDIGTAMAKAYNTGFQNTFDTGLFDQRQRIIDQLSEVRGEFDRMNAMNEQLEQRRNVAEANIEDLQRIAEQKQEVIDLPQAFEAGSQAAESAISRSMQFANQARGGDGIGEAIPIFQRIEENTRRPAVNVGAI